MRRSWFLSRIALALLAMFVMVASGCGPDAGPSEETKLGTDDTHYGIKVLIDTGKEEKLYTFAPVPESLAVPQSAPGTKPLGLEGVDDPTANPWSTAWALVWRAALECGKSDAVIPPGALTGSTDRSSFHIVGNPVSCVQSIKEQERLLCVADKMAEIADAVGPVVWPARNSSGAEVVVGESDIGAGSGQGSSGPLGGKWTIPPQSDKDRFIVRDLAIHIVGQIPYLASVPLGALRGRASNPQEALGCTQLMTNIATGGTTIATGATLNQAFQAAFGIQLNLPTLEYRIQSLPFDKPMLVYENPSGTKVLKTDNSPLFARFALTMQTQVLRGAGNLLHDLVRRSVYSDLAGAEQRRAAAMDTVRGGRVAWGDEGPYNSYAHAVRVLAGRWEMTPAQPDPACGGIKALDLLAKAYGDERSARTDDRPITTQGQATAARLVEQAGIALPECALATSDAAMLRKMLKTQLQLQTETAHNLPPDPNGIVAQAIARTVDSMRDEDLFFAFERTARTYRLLTGLPALPANACAYGAVAAPLAAPSTVAGDITARGGVAVDGGLARARLSTDAMARAGQILGASQCAATDGLWSRWGAWVANPSEALPDPLPVPKLVFQDVFQMGQAIARELKRIEAKTAALPLLQERSANPAPVARSGMAEIKGWAGAGLVVLQDVAAGMMELRFSGFDLRAYARAADDTDGVLAQRFADAHALVAGPAWMAECAAGVRTGCPSNVDLRRLSSVAFLNKEHAQNGITDFFSGKIALPTTLLVYLVRLGTPENRGEVLGALAVPRAGTQHGIGEGLAVSPMRRELLDMVLGLGKWVGERPSRLGDPSASLSGGYCLEDKPRNMFVPLENELTADADPYENSWRHYLSLAKQAAERADRLGEELLQVGLRRDERREAAGEALGAICGDLGAVQDVKVDGAGNVTPSKSDPALNMCLNEKTFDVVFLSSMPPDLPGGAEGKTSLAATKWIRHKVLRCCKSMNPADACEDNPPYSTNELCALSAENNPKRRELTYASLNIVSHQDPPKRAEGTCKQIARAASSLRTSFQLTPAVQAMAEPSGDAMWLSQAASHLKMVVGPEGTWHVAFGDRRIMDSNPGSTIWPGCLRTGGSCVQSASAPQTQENARMYNTLYRWCAGASGDDVQKLALGCSDGRANRLDAEDAELHTLRWRVQGAMYLLAALGGKVPAGMFTTPIPAEPVDVEYLGNVPDKEPLALFRGRAEPDGSGGYRLSVNGGTFASIKAFGTAVTKSPKLVNFESQFFGMPNYYQEAWRDATYMLPWVQNSEIAAEPKPPYFGPGVVGNFADGVPTVLTWANGLMGSQCTSGWGALANVRARYKQPGDWDHTNFATPDGQQGILTDVVARAKTVYAGGAARFGEHACVYEYPWNPSPPCNSMLKPYEKGGGWPLMGGTHHWLDVPYVAPGTRVKYADEFPAWNRAHAFVNSMPPNGACGALVEVLGTYGLSCAARAVNDDMPMPLASPDIQTEQDIGRLSAWVQVLSLAAKVQASALYLQKVPERVVSDFTSQTVGAGTKRGERGAAFLKMEAALQQIPNHWIRVSSDFRAISDALRAAQLEIEAAEISNQAQLKSIALTQVRTYKEMADAAMAPFQSAVDSIVKIPVTGGASVVTAYAQVGIVLDSAARAQTYAKNELGVLSDLSRIAEKQKENAIGQALLRLSQATSPRWASIQTSLGDMRASAADVLAAGEGLEYLTARARYEAAKGTGEDYVVLPGRTDAVAIPVNTVLRRQSSATAERYQRALKDAKALAYMARRAIEQRIGVPLSAITWRVGPLDPPSSWHDDVCRTSGIDYQRLRKGIDPTLPEDQRKALEKAVVTEFADAFIGDYVARLESFVAYYNAAFPSHDADDTAILSMREDLAPREMECMGPSPNLLYHSEDLTRAVPLDLPATMPGWRVSGCAPDKCLVTLPGTTLAAPKSGPFDGPPVPSPGGSTPPIIAGGGVTWLVDVAAQSSMPTGASSAMVVQDVPVAAGRYVLSWWDQARTPDGSVGATAVPYVVAISGEQGRALASDAPSPFVPAQGASSPDTLWGARRTLAFDVASPQTVRVAFGAGGSGTLGSVAIAHVQLERVAPGAGPTPYVATGAVRTTRAGLCPVPSGKLRSFFERQCEKGVCFYELTRPITINTESLRDGESPLLGKLAQGNHNYRHLALAVNLVGQGILACDGSPGSSASCLGTGYVEYDLEHNARNAGILGAGGESRPFDFGIGGIRRGKGLAMERVLSFPLSSADESLLQQPGVDKPELRGRPLDGSYRLRIYESPQLRWERLQDVQIVLRYRYWSPINASGN